MYPNKNVTSENTEFRLAMLKLNTTFLLQRRCRPRCCNILYYYIIEPSSVETANMEVYLQRIVSIDTTR